MENQLKEGDKVKVLSNNGGSSNKPGDIGVVVLYEQDGCMRVLCEGGKDFGNWHPATELEKLED